MRVLLAGEDTLLAAAVRRVAPQHVLATPAALDWTDAHAVAAHLEEACPDAVLVTGGASAGIHANLRQPVDLVEQNLALALSVLRATWRAGIARLVYVGSSCCYPRGAPQPMREDALTGGDLEPSSAPYATAKLAAMQLVSAYRRQHGARFVTVIPGDLFGPGDDFDPERSHVVAALLRRFHEAKEKGLAEVAVWGTGRPVRDFVFADDAARDLLLVADRYDGDAPINAGSGHGTSIADLAHTMREVVGYAGDVRFDPSRPDGSPLKCLDSSRLAALGAAPRTPLRDALVATYAAWLARGAA